MKITNYLKLLILSLFIQLHPLLIHMFFVNSPFLWNSIPFTILQLKKATVFCSALCHYLFWCLCRFFVLFVIVLFCYFGFVMLYLCNLYVLMCRGVCLQACLLYNPVILTKLIIVLIPISCSDSIMFMLWPLYHAACSQANKIDVGCTKLKHVYSFSGKGSNWGEGGGWPEYRISGSSGSGGHSPRSCSSPDLG